MNRTLKSTITAVLLGTATLAVAQSPSESFADTIRQFQALSGAGPAFKPQPTFSNEPKAPAPRLSTREFQAMSSDSVAFKLPAGSDTSAFAKAGGGNVANQAVTRPRPAGIQPSGPIVSSPSN